MQNILRKIKESNKDKENWKTLMSTFDIFWAPAPKVYFFKGD